MYQSSDLMLTMAKDHQRELIVEADRHRLLNAARRWRKERSRKSHEVAARAPSGLAM